MAVTTIEHLDMVRRTALAAACAAELHVGGSLRVPSALPGQTFSLAFDVTVLPR